MSFFYQIKKGLHNLNKERKKLDKKHYGRRYRREARKIEEDTFRKIIAIEQNLNNLLLKQDLDVPKEELKIDKQKLEELKKRIEELKARINNELHNQDGTSYETVMYDLRVSKLKFDKNCNKIFNKIGVKFT